MTNLAARLCARAADGQILATQDFAARLPAVTATPLGATPLRGFAEPLDLVAIETLPDG
ncbi:MAG: hypothetical protein KIS96_07460 [Bauldia sp.]|nr:hypothetical protein [Bauldia sp.]